MANQTQAKEPDLNALVVQQRRLLVTKEESFKAMLPSHYTLEKFFAIIERAVMSNPDLLFADQASFLEAALQAAEDGLPPDGKRGAFVVFNTKVQRGGNWVPIKKVQWMPMIRGIVEKLYNTGKVKSALARAVCVADKYRLWVDDAGEHIEHEEHAGERGDVITYFAAVFMQDGTVYAEAMRPADVEKIKNVSKSKDNADGPWKLWYEEMAKKTIFKRLAKRLPMSVEIERMMSRDDEYFAASMRDITPGHETTSVRPKGLANRMAALADNSGVGSVDFGQPLTGETIPVDRGQQQSRQPAQKKAPVEEPDEVPMDENGAYDRGQNDKRKGLLKRAMPKEYRAQGNEALMDEWNRGYDEQAQQGD